MTEAKKMWRYSTRDMKRIDVTKENALSHMHIRPEPSRLLIRSLMFCNIIDVQKRPSHIATIRQCHISYFVLLQKFIIPINTSYRFILPGVAKCNEFCWMMEWIECFVTAAAFILLWSQWETGGVALPLSSVYMMLHTLLHHPVLFNW
jgi:hypothetical protein